MTTVRLMEMTLRKLDRPTDSDTVALYRERLLGYLNEAMLDLTAEFRPWRRDVVAVKGVMPFCAIFARERTAKQ